MSELVTVCRTDAPDTFAAIDALHCHVVAAIKKFGWAAALDALLSLYVYLSLGERGLADTKRRLDMALDALPEFSAAMAAVTGQDPDNS